MRLEKILIRPLNTEKSTTLKEKQNKYVFEVHGDANKIEIKKTIEELFKVTVTSITTSWYLGKVRRLGRNQGKRSDWKKAIVTLKAGDTIKLVEEV